MSLLPRGSVGAARLLAALCVLPMLASCAVTEPVRAVPVEPGEPAAHPMTTAASPPETPTPSPTLTTTVGPVFPEPDPGAAASGSTAPGSTAPGATEPRATASSDPAPSPAASQTRAPQPAQPGETDCAKVACVALTFDDGPGPHTAKLLDSLDANGAKVTFFLRGDHAAEKPALVRRMAAAGHEVGSHTYSHPELTRLSAARQRSQIDRGVQAITDAGVTPTLFRPPYGAYDAATKRSVGAPLVLWSVDTRDWKTRSTETTVTTVLNQAKAGSVVLMHDSHPTTVAAVPRIVDGLRERGYTLVRVSDMVGDPAAGTVITHGRHPA